MLLVYTYLAYLVPQDKILSRDYKGREQRTSSAKDCVVTENAYV
jgi:hypothetical protein